LGSGWNNDYHEMELSVMRETVLFMIDGVLDLLFGALLIAFPTGFMNALGMPAASSPFYTMLLGGVLVGIGLGLILQQLLERPAERRGVEVPIAANLAGAGVLIALLVSGRLSLPIQGEIVLWAIAIIVLGFGVGEIVLHVMQTSPRHQVGEPLHSQQ
jgi:hypothetical protein